MPCFFVFSCSNNLSGVNVTESNLSKPSLQANSNDKSKKFLSLKSIGEVANFNQDAYLIAFSDVLTSVNNGSLSSGFFHFINYGEAQGRLLNAQYIQAKNAINNGFNEQAYLIAFPDVKYAVDNGLYGLTRGYDHYINTGMAENRLSQAAYIQAKPRVLEFDEAAYLTAFSDVGITINNRDYDNGYAHYLNKGIYEGRLNNVRYSTAKYGYDEIAYVTAFPDIKLAVTNGSIPNGHAHFLTIGRSEGRLLNPAYSQAKTAIANGFNEQDYLIAFSDIRNAVNNGSLASAYAHYKDTGINEGRLNDPGYLFEHRRLKGRIRP